MKNRSIGSALSRQLGVLRQEFTDELVAPQHTHQFGTLYQTREDVLEAANRLLRRNCLIQYLLLLPASISAELPHNDLRVASVYQWYAVQCHLLLQFGESRQRVAFEMPQHVGELGVVVLEVLEELLGHFL